MSVALEEKKDPAGKFGAQVDEQIAQATGRIRTHDLTLGGLTIGAMVAVYATTMIVADRYLNLSESVRQLSLFGFLAALAVVGYWLIVRPLRKRINPLYAASRVEKTIDDAKNSVTGYVEARENGEIHNAVKAAMSAKAAKAVVEADVNRAVDHRSLLAAGGVLLLFLLTLAVLFLVFRPAQFRSLIGRAFLPFSASPIAKRTQITLLKPDPADPTITTGQTITVAIYLEGKIPSKTSREHARVLLRHNPADPNYEEVAMEEGETSRDWQVKVPDHLVQNGFWYKVAAGDAETPEYRVTVRTLPLFTDFEAFYEYPAYTRKPADKSTGSNLRAYKGTKVTLRAKTNREVTEGWMRFESPGLAPVHGATPPDANDTLQFKFTATEASRYRLFMTTVTLEKNTDPPFFTLALDSDQPPSVLITKPEIKPEEAETTAPANGQLAVDGLVGDDFGIDKLRLRMRAEGRELAPVPYMNGKSFLRAKDNTWPTDMDFKLSADLTKLTYADGTKFEPKEGTVIDYWVEAIDNCTEAKPVEDWDKQVGNVGRSTVQKLRLTAPQTAPEQKDNLDQQRDQRQNEEQQHNREQQKKLDTENREKKPQDGAPQQPNDGKEPPKDGEPKKQEGGMPESKSGEPKSKDGEPKSKEGEPKKNESSSGMGGMSDPMQKTDPKSQPDAKDGKSSDGKGGMGGMPDAKMPPDPTAKQPEGKQPEGAKSSETPKGGNQSDSNSKTDPNNMGGMGGGMGNKSPDPAPMPKTPEEKQAEQNRQQAEQDANRVQEELNKNRGEGGDAKPNPGASAQENRTDPAQSKPQQQPDGGMDPQPKEGPKPAPTEPMSGNKDQGSASESKPAGDLEKPTDPDPTSKPQPKPADPKSGAKSDGKAGQPSESRSEPLGGTPGQDKPEPKAGEKTAPKDPNNQNKDPNSGATGKPSTEKKDGDGAQPNETTDKKDPTAGAGQSKPKTEPARGQDKPNDATKPGSDEKPKDDPKAGTAKPERAPPSGETKPMPKEGDPTAGKQPDTSETKPAPKDSSDAKRDSNPAEAKPDRGQPMGQGKSNDKPVERGIDKPNAKEQPDGKADPLAKKDQPKGGQGGKDEEKIDPAKLKELQDAAKDLASSDKEKQQAARDKLDKELGKDGREAVEKKLNEQKAELDKLQKDLQSPDKATRENAEKKFKDMMDQARKDAEKNGQKPKEPSAEEIADLAKKANDLNSKDDATRRAAEQALDEKLGKEGREKLQEEMKKQPPMPMDQKAQDELKKKLDELAKKNNQKNNTPSAGKGPIDWHTNTPGASQEPPKSAMEDDPRNRAKSAQLQLEEFEKHLYDKDLHDKLGWTPEQYRKFLEAQAKRVEELQQQAQTYEESQRNPQAAPAPGAPTIGTASGGKVDATTNGSNIEGRGAAGAIAPPGFEDAKRKFQELLDKRKQKQ